MLPLITSRLILRDFLPDDAEPFAAYRSDPEVARFQAWEAPYSLDKAEKFIAELQTVEPATPGEWYQIAIELKDIEELIGDCAFCVQVEEPDEAEIGYTLAPAYQGHGFATEAVMRLLNYLFEEIDLNRVFAYCDVNNHSSIRLLERAGMRREAYLADNAWSKGAWVSEYLYALSREAWAARSAEDEDES